MYFWFISFFFFFKQKTAYEMRISDWSSDVCSSDLAGHADHPAVAADAAARGGIVGDDVVFAEQRDDGAIDEGNARRHLVEVLEDPARVFLGNGKGLVHRRAARPHHPHTLARWAQPDRKSVRVGKECVSTCIARW